MFDVNDATFGSLARMAIISFWCATIASKPMPWMASICPLSCPVSTLGNEPGRHDPEQIDGADQQQRRHDHRRALEPDRLLQRPAVGVAASRRTLASMAL